MWTASFRSFVHSFDLLSSLVGTVAGVGAVLFQILGQLVTHFALTALSGFTPGEAAGEQALFQHSFGAVSLALVVTMMGLGGLVSGWLVYTFAPEAEGHGTDAAIESFHNKRGVIRTRVPFIKTLASAITIGTGGTGGTGGSAGREGPIAQIGAGFGSFLGTHLHLSDRDRRIMLAAGMAGGVGAVFRAPLAGALFAGEILYKDGDIESDVIVPAAISSIVSFSVYSLFLPADAGFLPLFGDGLDYQLASQNELIPLAFMAVVLTLAAICYIRVFYGIHALSKRITGVPQPLKPAVGAILAGLIGVGLHLSFGGGHGDALLAVLATGYGSLQTALENPASLGIGVLLLIAGGKVLTTSLTISSGGSGGVFGPSMVIGAVWELPSGW